MRYATFPIKLRALFSSIQARFVLPFLLVEVVTVLVLVNFVDWKSFKFRDSETIRRTTGYITGVSRTSASVNKVPVMGYHFRYRIPGEEETRTGVSYRTGRLRTTNRNVVVEYLEHDTGCARIKGMRSGIMSPFFLIIILPFMVVSVVFLVSAWKKAKNVLAVLEQGEITRGRLLNQYETGTRVNRRRVTACTFEYRVNGERYTVTARTHRPEQVTDEDEERIVYNPEDPARAVVLDALPARLRTFLETGF